MRLESIHAPLGKHVFQLDYTGKRWPTQTGQFLSKELVGSLRGKTVTLGAWVWSDRIVGARAPFIRFVTDQHGFVDTSSPIIRLRATPVFFQTVISVPPNASYAMVVPPFIALNGRKMPLFFDGVVLAQGSYPTGAPQFDNAAGGSGNWSGHPFRNLIENGSAEQAAPRIRPAIDEKASAGLANAGRLSAIFSLTADWRGTGWYYGVALQTLLRTFWASVAADKFHLPSTVANNVLLGLTIAGMLGVIWLSWRRRRELRWDLVYVLLVAGVLVWGVTLARSTSSLFTRHPSFPFARYAFPAILPSALLICGGWAEWLLVIGNKYRLSAKALYLVPLSMMALLSLYTLFNVEKYFHPSLASREWLLWLGGILIVAFALLWKRDQLKASFKEA